MDIFCSLGSENIGRKFAVVTVRTDADTHEQVVYRWICDRVSDKSDTVRKPSLRLESDGDQVPTRDGLIQISRN